MTKIIQEGIVYVLSMLNPAGAIVQAVRAIYNGIMFFMDNAERIKDLVSAITNSIADIAAGKIGTAAKYITDSLIRTIPIVLSFLSHLLKLNKITEVLRKAVDKVRKPIEKAIKKGVKWLVKKVKKWLKSAKKFFLGKGKDSKPKKVAETSGEDKARVEGEEDTKEEIWWKEYEEFELSNEEEHKLYFKGKGVSAVLYMASKNPEPVEKKLKAIPDKKIKNKKKLADTYIDINSMRKFIKNHEDKQKTKGKETFSIADPIDDYLKDIRKNIQLAVAGLDDLPLSNVTYVMENGKAKEVIASPLTKLSGNTKGQDSSGHNPNLKGAKLTKLINDTTLNKKGKATKNWVNFHLLSAMLHGPSEIWNLVPTKKRLNSTFNAGFEQKRKGEIKKGNILYLKIVVDYYKSSDDFSDFSTDDEELKKILKSTKKSDFPEKITAHWQTFTEAEYSKLKKDKQDLGANLKKYKLEGDYSVPVLGKENDTKLKFEQLYSHAQAIVKADKESESPKIKTSSDLFTKLNLYNKKRFPNLTEKQKQKIKDLVS